jgi:seryl-tRNA synthetase
VAAILENYQTPRGIIVPVVLIPYMDCDLID